MKSKCSIHPMRCYRLVGIALACVLGFTSVAGRAQNANDGFAPNADNTVLKLAVQADGKLLVGGDFTSIAGNTRSGIARLLPDGSLDPTFPDPVVDGPIQAFAVQADGKILIGGTFHQVGVSLRNNIARLNPDGSVDLAFNPNAKRGGIVFTG